VNSRPARPPPQGQVGPHRCAPGCAGRAAAGRGQAARPRADGDREALGILLCARAELTSTATGQASRLRALLRDGDDRDLADAPLSAATLTGLARRRQPRDATREQAARQSEIRRLPGRCKTPPAR